MSDLAIDIAGVSKRFRLYHEKYTSLKERIIHLRAQQTPKAQIKIPKDEQASSASKDAMIAALRQRIQKLHKENSDLKRQVEIANGLLYQRGEAKP